MADSENTQPERRSPWLADYDFRPGNPGRPKGARNRFAEKFINDFMADWNEHGIATIQKVRTDKPDIYLRAAVAILPKQFDVNSDDIDNLSAEQLDERLADIEARTAALAQSEAGPETPARGTKKPSSVH